MPRTILVIDDERPILNLVRNILTEYAVIAAINPEEALEKLRIEQIDLVLTDIDMPQMDGLELIMRVKTLHPKIPIIAMSGTVFQGDGYAFAVQLGASAAIGKPFHPADLRQLIGQFLPEEK